MESGQFFSDFQETFHEVPKPTESDRPIRCFVDVSILPVDVGEGVIGGKMQTFGCKKMG